MSAAANPVGAGLALLEAAVLGPLRQGPGRTIVAVVAIALGVALGFSVYLINRVAADEVELASRSLFGIADLSVRAPGPGFEEQLYPAIARVPGVAVASPVVEAMARIPGQGRPLKLVGIDPFRASRLLPAVAVAGASAAQGAGLLAANSVWLSPAAAQAYGVGVGEDLNVQFALDVVTLHVAGLLPPDDYRQPVGIMDIATAQWRLGRLGHLNRVDLRLQPGANPKSVSAAIRALLPSGVMLATPGEASDDALRLSRAYRSNLTALALVALFTGAFLVYATQSLAVARRRREIALLHALGLTVREQLAASLLSGAVVGMLGAAAGVLFGIVVARTGLAVFGADLGAGYFRGPAPELDVHVLEATVFFVLGVGAAVAATLGPAHEAASVPAAAALRAGDEAPIDTRRHGLIALALFVVAGVALFLPAPGGVALPGYVAIACILLGAVFLAPGCSQFAFRHLPLAGPAWIQIASAQLRGTARRSTVSIGAVLVSVSLMVAMAIMVFSFRLSLDSWMRHILYADLYVRAGSSGLTSFLDDDAQLALSTLPGVRRVDFVRYQQVSVPGGGLPVTIIARPIDEQRAPEILQIRRTDPDPAPAGTVAAWVSEALCDLHGLDVGAVFELPLGGRNVKASVRGVWRDYDERPGGAVVIPRAFFVRQTGDTSATTAALQLAEGVSTHEVSVRIRDALRRGGEYEISVPREIRVRSLRVFDRTFAVTYLLEAIAVLIGLFGISASTSSQVLARRAEFGMLRHLGVTRGEIGRMLAYEGAVLGSMGVASGLVVGGIVSLILVYVVNRQSFHWTMDLHVPWLPLVALSVVLVAAAALTAAFSGRQATRIDVVRAVKEDW